MLKHWKTKADWPLCSSAKPLQLLNDVTILLISFAFDLLHRASIYTELHLYNGYDLASVREEARRMGEMCNLWWSVVSLKSCFKSCCWNFSFCESEKVQVLFHQSLYSISFIMMGPGKVMVVEGLASVNWKKLLGIRRVTLKALLELQPLGSRSSSPLVCWDSLHLVGFS